MTSNWASHPFAAVFASAAAYVLASAAIAFAWHASERHSAAHRLDRFGTAIAQTLAAQATEAVLTRDRIGLGVAANRILQLPEVAGIGVYTIDDAPVAVVGDASDRPQLTAFTAAVTMDDTIAAYVRVSMVAAAFRTSMSLPAAAWAWWLGGLLAATAVGFAFSAGTTNWLANVKRRGAIDTVSAGSQPSLPTAVLPEHVYVLIVNLFNQISFPPAQKAAALDTALGHVRQIANLYAGRAERLSGTGLLMAFDDTKAEERGFEVLCAALLTARMLRDLNHAHFQNARPELVFRYGLHRAPFHAEHNSLKESQEVRDSVMLSAIAPDGNLVVSAEVFDALPRTERLNASAVRHPALAALATTAGSCHIVTSVADSYQALLERQAELLGA